jgi:hypothetical protein
MTKFHLGFMTIVHYDLCYDDSINDDRDGVQPSSVFFFLFLPSDFFEKEVAGRQP